jgi:uncharacterized protein (DUF305 family)
VQKVQGIAVYIRSLVHLGCFVALSGTPQRTATRLAEAAIVTAAFMAGCGVGQSRRGAELPPVAVQQAPAARAREDSVRNPYTPADVHFMTGMISHHAQAIKMSSWAKTHDANTAVLRLAERIIVGQTDEIVLMQTWLRDRLQPAPEPDPAGMKMTVNGVEHTMLMPGMLTPEQMQQLDLARGADFDRRFLTFMIQHHRGAIAMVKDLFAHPGAGQDESVFRLASDISADQTNEIARMQKMLLEPRAPTGAADNPFTG